MTTAKVCSRRWHGSYGTSIRTRPGTPSPRRALVPSDMAIRSISLFSGGAGLDLGVALACPGARVVCYVEREAYAASALVARMQDGTLDPAPIWNDVASFDGTPWRGRVDLISGGFPCQDISVAGLGAGLDGKRSGLWYEYARIIAEVRPRFVFVENVGALISRGIDRVLGSLAALGFDAEWGCFRASDVGAPHRRERVFILAHTIGLELRDESGWWGGAHGAGAGLPRDPSPGLAYPDGEPCDLRATPGSESGHATGARDHVGHPDGSGLERRGEPVGQGTHERLAWPPGPTEHDRWLHMPADAQPAICRGAHGVAGGLEYRPPRLRLLGNGVVPDAAALAFRVLGARLRERRTLAER